jgi:hypothetical protein
MFEPVRGGTRGGQAEFKWSDVSADKDRENYLGHSINAPTGRWQKNKDVHWYNRETAQSAAERAEEIKKVKEAEAEALAAALGFEPTPKSNGPTGSNAAPLGPTSKVAEQESPGSQKISEKEEKRRKKLERKEEKRVRKEARRAERGEVDRERPRRRSRSRSPRRPHAGGGSNLPRPTHRSRSPVRPRGDDRPFCEDRAEYDSESRERERQRDRKRWDLNTQGDRPRTGYK